MKHTILLADDSVTIQKVVELTFLDEDVRVVSVGNGSDALARLEEVRPDVILADVHMPGADGYEVCRAAHRSLPGVPVMLLVGTFEIFDPERAAEVGASGHMKKPFDSQELLRRVRELFAAGRSAVPAAVPASVPEVLSTLPEVAFEPPVWEPEEEATPEPAVAPAETEGESWSFEPVAEAPAEAAIAPAEPAATEGWNAFATSRFEAPPAEPLSFEPEPEDVPEPEPSPALPVAAAEAIGGSGAALSLSEADFERLAQRVAEIVSERAVKDVAWEVVPDLAEVLLKARIRELEAAVE